MIWHFMQFVSLWRQFAWNVKSYFLKKKKHTKNVINFSPAEFCQLSGKGWKTNRVDPNQILCSVISHLDLDCWHKPDCMYLNVRNHIVFVWHVRSYFFGKIRIFQKVLPSILSVKISGPSCSKLTTSLVNDSLKFTSNDTQICWNFFAEKMWVAFALQKLLTFFQQNISEYCILNQLKQLTKWP